MERKQPLITEYYSIDAFIEIQRNFHEIEKPFDKFRYISRCSGIELVIVNKRYWFEFYGQQIIPRDIYIKNSCFTNLLHLACE